MPDDDSIKDIDKMWKDVWEIGFDVAVFGPWEAVEQFESSMSKCVELCSILIAARKSGMDRDVLLELANRVVNRLKARVN